MKQLAHPAKKTISHWNCKFINEDNEQEYINSKLKQDKRTAQFLILVVGFILLAILFSDKLIIKDEYWPHIALTWRGGIVFACFAAYYYINTLESPQFFHRFLLIFTATLLVNLQLMVFTYKDHYILHVFFDLIVLIAIYFSTLFSFRESFILGALYGLAGAAVIYISKSIETHSYIMVVIAYIAANAAGMVISAQEHLLKRRLFLRKERLAQLAKELKEQAFIDPLTNIPNRRAFDENYPNYQKLALRIENSEDSVCVVVSDIDFFKRVNDNFGHDKGDTVLVKFASFLVNSVRPTDGVYRFGGEEFVIVLKGCSTENAISRIENMVQQLSNNILDIEGIDYPITASFGIAFLNKAEDKRTIIARADLALYQAKDNGRNQLAVSQ